MTANTGIRHAVSGTALTAMESRAIDALAWVLVMPTTSTWAPAGVTLAVMASAGRSAPRYVTPSPLDAASMAAPSVPTS